MGGLTKSYHHYQGSTCVARYPIKHDRDGVWLMGPITIIRDKDGNVTEKWDERHAGEIAAGPFASEADAVVAIKRKLTPIRQKVRKLPGRDAFDKWKKSHEEPAGAED